MLVLTRKIQESVMVGGQDGMHSLLKVTVLDVAGGKVKLGFEVAADVPVHRLEVWERLRASGELHCPGASPRASDV
jgi:carbon storage regulator